MIKVSKIPKKYSVMTKVSTESMSDPIFMKYAKLDNKLKPIPRNALKIFKLKTITGLHKDDFVNNLTSIKTDYLVYTFKR